MTWIEIAREVAVQLEAELDDTALEAFLWECTGFPCFLGDSPEETLRKQLTEAIAPVAAAQRERRRETVPTRWDRLSSEDLLE